MGAHSLPHVLDRRTGAPLDQHMCLRCTLHAIHDERHLILEFPAMQPVQDRYPALFGPACSTILMWQPDTVGVAHYITDCFVLFCALSDGPDLHQPRLNRCTTFMCDRRKNDSMKVFIWQHDTVGVAHYIRIALMFLVP